MDRNPEGSVCSNKPSPSRVALTVFYHNKSKETRTPVRALHILHLPFSDVWVIITFINTLTNLTVSAVQAQCPDWRRETERGCVLSVDEISF